MKTEEEYAEHWYEGWTNYRSIRIDQNLDTDRLQRREWKAILRYWKSNKHERQEYVRG